MANICDVTSNCCKNLPRVLLVITLITAVALISIGLAYLGGSDIEYYFLLPLLAIGGVIALILVLTIVAAVFGFFDLADKDKAMGLPEGSVRAVVALSLIVLFTILAVYLYGGVSGVRLTVESLSEADRTQFIKDHPNKDVQSFAIAQRNQKGEVITNPDGSAKTLFTVAYRSEARQESVDFAKQMLVLLGTLMTAVTSFYLGAGTATSAAAAAAQTPGTTKPTITSVDPITYSISKGSTPPASPSKFTLKILGNNLNIITHVKIQRAGVQIIGTEVQSNPTQVTCSFEVTLAHTGLPWDVVVDDGASKSATLPNALTITN
jgi:hypothetical protein